MSFVLFKASLMSVPGKFCYIFGEFMRQDGNKILLKNVVWSNYPDWETYYPNVVPFNINSYWIVVDSILKFNKVISEDEIQKNIMLLEI